MPPTRRPPGRRRPLPHPLNVTIRTLVLASLLVCTPFAAAAAQAGAPAAAPSPVTRGALRGRVVDSASRAPLAIATVELTLAAGPAAPLRATSDADGRFHVERVPFGRYRLRIRALGYAPHDASLALDAAAPTADVGTVALGVVAVTLRSVVVTGEQEQVRLAPDRNVYVTKDMPATKGGNALDVLRSVPSVDVDIDNVVSLRGNSGVVVQINGRPSPMKPSQLGNFLAQLPADMVAKVEVVPNPSARDDPEGVAGIINIVLKEEADAGRSAGLTLTGGTTGRAEIGGNLGYQGGPLSLYGSYGFLRDSRPRSESIFRQNLFSVPTTYLVEDGSRTQIPLAHTVTGSASYKLGSHDELSAEAMYSTRTEAETNTIDYRNLDAARTLTALSGRRSRGTNHEFNLESTLGYKHAFAGKRHTLSGEARLFRAREGGPYAFTTQAFAPDGALAGLAGRESQLGYEHPDESTIKVDFARPLSSTVRVEAGYKGSLQTFHTTLATSVFDATRAAYVADTARTSDFTYDETVNAAYGMLNAALGPFVVQGGLRAERAATQFRLNTRNANYDNRYGSLFPSALVAYSLSDADQVKLSYSTRIRRPDDTDLIDPTLHFQDPLNVSRGNPYLRPEYIRAMELGFQRTAQRYTAQLTPFYRHTLDAVRNLRSIDTLGVTTRTFANVATTDAYGTDATVALRGGRLTGFAGASAYRQVSNASNLDPSLSARTFGWTARTNAAFRVSPTLDLQALLFYQAPMTVEQGRAGSRTRFSLAAREKLMDDRVNVTLRVIDPFNTSTERFTTSDPRFLQVSDRRRTIRGLVLSATWNFGRGPKDEDRSEGDPTLEGGGPR